MGQRFSRALGRDPNFVDLRPPRGPKNLPHCALNTLLCLKCGPYQVWVPNNAISGQGWDAIKEFERINLDLFTMRKFYGLFRRIDRDGGGSISLDEFFQHFSGVKSSPFGRRMFSIFDLDNSGEIDFKEFVMSIWNVCTANNSEFARFGFRMFDKDNSGALDMKEVREMVKFMLPHEVDGELGEQVEKILVAMDTDHSGQVSCDEFLAFCLENPVLLRPPLEMQRALRAATFGIRYWYAVSLKRYAKTSRRDPFAAAIQAALNMSRLQQAQALSHMMTVMDHTGHKSLATRQRLLDRFLPDDYGTAVMNKTAILTQGEHELELHAGLVQSDIELAKKQHTRTTRMADGTARRPGKLNRIRDTFGGKVEGAARVEEEKEEKEEPSAVSPMKGPKSAKVAPSDLKPAVSAASVSFVLKGAASPSSKSPLGAKPLKK